MFRHVRVPLDGARLAEAVLPVTAAFARALGAKVTLLHVVEPAAPATVHGDVHLTQAAQAETHLRGGAGWLAPPGWHAEGLVDRGGDAAAVIASRAASLEAD